MARPYANDLRRKFLHLKLFRQLPQGPFALLIGNRKLFGARSLLLGSAPPTIPGIPPERRAIHQQSAQEVGIWAGRGWRALRLVQQSVTLRKVTVESSACVAGAKAAFDGQSREEPRSQGGSRSMVLFPGGALQNEAEVSDARIPFVRRGRPKLQRLDAT